MMPTLAAEFEQLIERIYRLLGNEGAVVTWNDKVPDPDNPDQSRQIDITIVRDGFVTYVECRIRQSPQDVTWVEELIGRKSSLRPSAIVAVSASGFTKGAILKAKAFGIHLRKLDKLSDEEVLIWSKAISVKAVFYEFIDNEILIAVPSLPSSPIVINNNDGSDFTFRTIFESVMKELDNKPDLEQVTYRITVPSTSSSMIVNGTSPSKITLSSTVRRIVKTLTVEEVLGYINPEDGDGPVSMVQKHSQGVEIIETGDKVSVALSLGAGNSFVPPNCFFHRLFF